MSFQYIQRGASLWQRKRMYDYQGLFLHYPKFRLCVFLAIKNFVLSKKVEESHLI